MERRGHLPGGVISEIANMHSRERYVVSTAPELGQDYWTTALMPVVVKRGLFGLVKRYIPDVYHPIATWTRNSKEDAHQAHAEVRHVVITISEDQWFDQFPRPVPPDGYSEGAKAKLRGMLGEDADIPE